jgi:Fe-S cluster biosynthesis and repair protein YggX
MAARSSQAQIQLGPALAGAGQETELNPKNWQEVDMARMVQCVYLKKEAEGLGFSPYPGELGKRIYDNISKEAFEAWKKHQTMLVNENRLNLADARARQYLARQMEQFLFGGDADKPAGYVPPAP